MNMNTRLRNWVGRVIQGALVGALGWAVVGTIQGGGARGNAGGVAGGNADRSTGEVDPDDPHRWSGCPLYRGFKRTTP